MQAWNYRWSLSKTSSPFKLSDLKQGGVGAIPVCGNYLVISNSSTRPEKGENKTNQKNILSVKPVAVALALNHFELPWLFVVMVQLIFEQFSAITRKSKMIL